MRSLVGFSLGVKDDSVVVHEGLDFIQAKRWPRVPVVWPVKALDDSFNSEQGLGDISQNRSCQGQSTQGLLN